MAFSPDGSKVLTGSWDMTAKLWDAATGEEIRIFSGHTYSVNFVAFSPDGSKVLTGSGDKTAKLWNADTGEEIRTFVGQTRDYYSVAFSPDGAKVLTGSGYPDYTAKLWDAATGTEIRTFSGHTGFYVRSVAFSPDGSKVLTGSDDYTVKLWNATTGAEIRTFSAHTYGVLSVAFSPDGSKVLTGSIDSTAMLWDINGDANLVDSTHPIRLTLPNGGQTLEGGSMINVGWITDLPTAGSGVHFELWDGLKRIAYLGYDWDPAGGGYRELYLPLVPVGSNYKIRVVSTWDPTLYDESDAPLTITGGPLRLDHPTGGEIWRTGDREWIWWESNPDISGTAVRLELWRGDAQVAGLGAGYDIDGEGVTEITVPPVPSGADYQVRIVSIWNPIWFAESPGFFRIKNPTDQNAVGPKDWIHYR